MSIVMYDLAGADPALRFSPYCWRMRMALAHKGMPVETIPWRFTDKAAIGFSGQGEAMACNRVKGARAAVYYGGQEEVLRLSREHNNANILSLGAKFVSIEEAKEAVEVWLATDFSRGERHVRRIQKLDATA